MKCEKCGKEHNGLYASGRFCSQYCSRSFSTFNTRKEINKKVSIKLSQPEKYVYCSSCGIRITRNHKMCIKCSNKDYTHKLKISIANKGKTGGYRPHSGRSISGYYKGIYCGSTYELVWVIYRIDHMLIVKRFNGYIQNDKIKYFPDFVDEHGTIIEIKGRFTPEVDEKTQLAITLGYNIKVLYLKDLEKEFNWVKINYNYKFIQELYDNFKPKYSYTCDNCGKIFIRDKKRKTKNVFCCRSCVGSSTKGTKRIKMV